MNSKQRRLVRRQKQRELLKKIEEAQQQLKQEQS